MVCVCWPNLRGMRGITPSTIYYTGKNAGVLLAQTKDPPSLEFCSHSSQADTYRKPTSKRYVQKHSSTHNWHSEAYILSECNSMWAFREQWNDQQEVTSQNTLSHRNRMNQPPKLPQEALAEHAERNIIVLVCQNPWGKGKDSQTMKSPGSPHQ